MRRLRRSAAAAALAALSVGSWPAGALAAGPEDPPAMTADAWRRDLDYLVGTLERVHPDLYARVDRAAFSRAKRELAESLPSLDDAEIVVRLMQLVALVQDGHTSLEPSDRFGFDHWYPLRFYRFSDGIFITAAPSDSADLLGAEVLRMGDMPAAEAWAKAGTLLGCDNEFDALQRAPVYLSNATVLELLGITPERDRLRMRVRKRSGAEETVSVDAVTSGVDLSFRFWGEMWGPASEVVDYVGFDGRASKGFYERSADLPLHLRYRRRYFTYEPDAGMLYVQINHLGDGRDETFAEFSRRLWEEVDRVRPDLFVLDIRYNIGGDGSLVEPFVREIIKRDRIDRKGHLFTIVGRATFSAGVMLARAMEAHTANTFVGEPAGAYWKSFGDNTSFELPASGLTVWVSTIYHQLSDYVGEARVLPVELPARFSSADYFAGRDPALTAILGSRSRPLLANVFMERGGEAALAEYERRLEAYGGIDWWAPFSLDQLDEIGDELRDAGRLDDATVAYRLNARRHPRAWRVWYSLGEIYRTKGETENAIESYEEALAVDPFNNMAPFQREALEELRTGASSGSGE